MVIRTLGSRYLLDVQIGQGGMGVVWRGRDKVTGSPFAIKLLRSEYAADPDAVTRFVRERTVLMKFRHPAVVTVHDMIVEGDQLALVMDLVDGGDLNAYRRRNGGTLTGAEAARFAAQVCDGLAAAHAAAIVHRDLKPANVLLDAGRVKLADFGVARIVGDPSGTTTGTVLGTAAYLAPELLTGNEPSPATDMYAFGITLYELLAGAPPFAGHVAAIMHDHLQTAPSRPPGVADRLWDLLSSCLAKEPAARPAAAAMGSALRDPGLLAVLAQAAPVVPVVPAGRAAVPAAQAVPEGAPVVPVAMMPLSAPPLSAPPLSAPPAPPITAAEPIPAAQRPMPAPPQSFAQAPVIPLHRQPGGMGTPPTVAAPAPGVGGLGAGGLGAGSLGGEAPVPAAPVAGAPVAAPVTGIPGAAPAAGDPFPAFPGPFQQASPQPQSPLAQPPLAQPGLPQAPAGSPPRRPAPGKRRSAPGKRRPVPGKRRIEASPAVIGTAAIVALLLVATGVMALGRFGPFASAPRTSAGARPSDTTRVVGDPGRSTASASGPSTTPSHRSGSGHAKKPTASRSHSPITPTATGSARTGGGTGGTGGTGGSRPLVPYGPNLVTDGNFSDPTLTAWNYAVYQALLSPGAGVSGQNAVLLTATPEAGIAETISGLQSGGHYRLTGWVEATASPIYIGARDDASGKEVDVSAEPATWDKLSLDFTVPSGQTSAVVFCVQRRGGSGSCSNISVHALHAG